MIHHGDCLQVLKTLAALSCDALVTDPPAGIGFMGKGWDGDRGGREQWVAWLTEVMAECHRVLKPGAHALVWAIPRTSHWTMTALEDAGFEIRDVVTHLFGTGFPKSLDVSKAIDKEAGAKREVVGKRTDGRYASSFAKTNSQFGEERPNTDKIGEITAPATDAARQWEGFGTALKPACEFWVLCRKPISEKTVANNVLKWGTGALNIDASRISPATKSGKPNTPVASASLGRFPSNLILDEEAAAAVGDNARYFYVAKASKTDRGEGNVHPTVKSTKLMSYLVRLISPPGGIVLDPFMGSGSTGVAAAAEGLAFIGIEQQQEYVEIALRRGAV